MFKIPHWVQLLKRGNNLRRKTMLKNFVVVVAISSIVFSGCASIMSGSNQTIPIKSIPSEATLKVYDKKGEVIINDKTPFIATLKRGTGFFSRANYRAVVEKEGYESKEIKIEGRLNGWYLGGNLLFGGLIGWLIVDPASGAMWTLEPKEINTDLTGKSSLFKQNDGLMIVLLEAIPVNLLQKMHPVTQTQ